MTHPLHEADSIDLLHSRIDALTADVAEIKSMLEGFRAQFEPAIKAVAEGGIMGMLGLGRKSR